MVIIQRLNIGSNLCNSTEENQKCFVKHLLLFQFKSYSDEILNLIEKYSLAELFLDICEDCAKMAALPHGAFAACKLRENHDRELLIMRLKSATENKNKSDNKKMMEYTPDKYNDKLMNSIWGLYNRYSPHNIKSNECESNDSSYFMQQQVTVASHDIAEHFSAMSKNSIKEWRFMEKQK